MMPSIIINGRPIGPGHPTYIIAEMSANHNQDYGQAKGIVKAAKEAGADAIKLQTYTPDTLTINCDNDYFRIKDTLWEGRTLYDLYSEAYTPWEWQPKLKALASSLGLDFISTPFDTTAVNFLEDIGVVAYKVASFELVDLSLLCRIAATGKPVIMSTGMATLAEIDEAVHVLQKAGCHELALLKCTSAYPAQPEDINLRTISHLAETFGVVSGLSDHTLGIAVPVAAVAQGAVIVEKHLALSRQKDGPDNSFSLEPHEFKSMVDAIREAEKAMGRISYSMTDQEKTSRVFRRSLFIVKNIHIGDFFSEDNIRSIRPGYGLHPRYLKTIIGRRVIRDLDRGTPLAWEHVGEVMS